MNHQPPCPVADAVGAVILLAGAAFIYICGEELLDTLVYFASK